MINKHKSNKIKENSNTVRHLNNGTDHRHSKSCCDQSSPARRTIIPFFFYFLTLWGQHHILEIYINLIRLRVERFRWHDDVIKWKHFPRYWPFVRGIHRSLVNSPYKGQWRGALIFSLICAWINGWVNNREAGDLRRHRAHYDVIVTDKT